MSDTNSTDDYEKKDLTEIVDKAQDIITEFKLDPLNVNYWLVTNDEINKLAAYEGFQIRYPHWRWGMNYSQQKKKDTYFGGKIFELVNNDTICNAFLQKSNSLSEQKSVIVHVEAHADFFNNNNWFKSDPKAAEMLERHSNIVESYYENPDIARTDVEEWIDALLCIENTIDLHNIFKNTTYENKEDNSKLTMEEKIESLDLSESVKRQVFSDIIEEDKDNIDIPEYKDVLKFLIDYGKQYDKEHERAIEYEDWQKTLINIIRDEAYYFAPQKMTKIMNEGWASFWESMIMSDENFADDTEFIDYADNQSKVLASPGLNPYKLGKSLWNYIENHENRREVVNKLLKIDGINWRNFHNELSFVEINNILKNNINDDIMHEKHYSLLRLENRNFIKNIKKEELKIESRYIFENNLYDTVEEALNDVDYEKGWSKMREIRETHNDITFIDSFLTEEFIQQQKYFSYEYNPASKRMEVSGTDLDSVKKNLLLHITNGGKPYIYAADNNFNNSGELLLKHKYNGVMLNTSKATDVLKKIFKLWGRPVNLKTIIKSRDGEVGVIYRYNGQKIKKKEVNDIDDIKANEIDYNTKPDDWL